jgi:ribonucleoside-diphosphate reductase alpha chain
VEKRYVDQLPIIASRFEHRVGSRIVVEDSREGWAAAFRELIDHLYHGFTTSIDTSKVRPKGARLHTFGGRASGPGPLLQLFDFTVQTFVAAAGRRLTPLEVHDIACKVGEVIVSGGVRRSALISLSDLSDFEMAKSKSGTWWENNGQRALANNSAVYVKKPSAELFLREWRNLIESQSGERGIFNLAGIQANVPNRRDGEKVVGTNPCGEISLRNMGLCNLTEIVVRPNDGLNELVHKAEIASIIGTWQSTLTKFKYVRSQWRKNAEEERLLGVSLTGIYGNVLLNDHKDRGLTERLAAMQNAVVAANEREAEWLGIEPSVSTTTIKPSGTVSQLTGVSSGIHPWHSEYYIRTVRGSNSDPLTRLMMDSGVPFEPDVMNPDNTTVFSFPVEAPPGAVTRNEITALDHLEMYKVYRMWWAEHQVSITVTVRPEEWVPVANWVWENWDIVAGVSFLPHTEHSYAQAPYQEVTVDEYEALRAASPSSVRFADLSFYEFEDETKGARELACSSDTGCEDVDIA